MFFMMETNSLLVLANITLSLDIAKRISTELNTCIGDDERKKENNVSSRKVRNAAKQSPLDDEIER